jgi:metal-sulfur cluster biosynthetic enzyme
MATSAVLINENPRVYEVTASRAESDRRCLSSSTVDDTCREAIDADELFEWIRHIHDPEHPYTLEQLHVVVVDQIAVDDAGGTVLVEFTPTIPHCTMATLIGLSIRVRLMRCLSRRFKVAIRVTPGSHQTEDQVNRQLNDKERVAAALENQQLLALVNQCLASCT